MQNVIRITLFRALWAEEAEGLAMLILADSLPRNVPVRVTK
jgi:hypothetical protein